LSLLSRCDGWNCVANYPESKSKVKINASGAERKKAKHHEKKLLKKLIGKEKRMKQED